MKFLLETNGRRSLRLLGTVTFMEPYVALAVSDGCSVILDVDLPSSGWIAGRMNRL